jgi:hypothetical protein
MEPRRLFRPVLADTHHVDDQSDPESHKNDGAGPDADPQHCLRVSLSIRTVLL